MFENADVAIEATGIEKSFSTPAGPLCVLSSLDLEVARGTILAIVGVSGVGKSTLLNILGTLDRADRGTLKIGGVPVSGLRDSRLAAFRSRRIGFVFQNHHLLPEFTAEENVMMPLRISGRSHEESRREAQRLLEAVGLRERWLHRPVELSGGEAQRVAMARALIASPDLVLADEPSGDLDREAADHLHAVIQQLARERRQTFVVVTHNERLAAIADRVLRLEGGRLHPVAA